MRKYSSALKPSYKNTNKEFAFIPKFNFQINQAQEWDYLGINCWECPMLRHIQTQPHKDPLLTPSHTISNLKPNQLVSKQKKTHSSIFSYWFLKAQSNPTHSPLLKSTIFARLLNSKQKPQHVIL